MEAVHWWILPWMPLAKYSHRTALILIWNALSILNVMLINPYHQILLLLVMILLINGEQWHRIGDIPTLGLYLHRHHLMLIFGLAKVLLLMLVNSSQWLAVLAITGNYNTVIYTLNRMDNILELYTHLSVSPPLVKLHFHMHGLIIHTKHQHCNIIFAG